MGATSKNGTTSSLQLEIETASQNQQDRRTRWKRSQTWTDEDRRRKAPEALIEQRTATEVARKTGVTYELGSYDGTRDEEKDCWVEEEKASARENTMISELMSYTNQSWKKKKGPRVPGKRHQ